MTEKPEKKKSTGASSESTNLKTEQPEVKNSPAPETHVNGTDLPTREATINDFELVKADRSTGFYNVKKPDGTTEGPFTSRGQARRAIFRILADLKAPKIKLPNRRKRQG